MVQKILSGENLDMWTKEETDKVISILHPHPKYLGSITSDSQVRAPTVSKGVMNEQQIYVYTGIYNIQ